MAKEMDLHNTMPPVINKIDPTEFDVTVSALLIGIGADKFIEKFRKQNIGQCTLMELTDEDLIKLGVDDAGIRKKLMDEAKNLPLYEEASVQSKNDGNLGPMEIVDVLEESSQHLYKIYLSVLANTLAMKKTKKIQDSLLHKDLYASDIALDTLTEITNILNSIDVILNTQTKLLTVDSNINKKKLIFGSVGGAVVVILGFLFVRALKQLK